MLTWSYFFLRMIQPYTLSNSAILPFLASALGVGQPRIGTFESKFFFPFIAFDALSLGDVDFFISLSDCSARQVQLTI